MRAAVIVLVVLAAPALARAECPDRRVLTFEGECCWLGQTWDGARCVGPPECPAPLIADGDTCVARMRPPPRVSPPETIDPLRAPPPPALEETRSIRHTLVGFGVAQLLTGWTGSTVMSAIAMSFGAWGPQCRITYAPWGFFPVFGSAVVPVAVDVCETGDTLDQWLVFGAATTLQAAGLTMLLIGTIDREHVWRSVRVTARGVSIRF